jgi:glyoxylate utilization-related uncharacterized protein
MTCRRSVIVAAGVLLAAAALVAQGKTVVWPAESIKWSDMAAVPGAKQAVLWGDPTRGAYGAFKLVPAGTVLPPHTHKNGSRVVIVAGNITLDIEGKATRMTPGSYSFIPGGVPHSATCHTGSPCQYFEQMEGAFDSAPAKK